MSGIVAASWISRVLSGSAMRATPPSRRMSAGTRSSAITATAPASSAIRACSAVVTSMITPPLSISARPLLTRIVPISAITTIVASRPTSSAARAGARHEPRPEGTGSALEAAEDLVLLVDRGRDRPEQDGILLRAHHVPDVRAQLLRREVAEGPLDGERVVRALAEGDRERVARLVGQQAAVRGRRRDYTDPRVLRRDVVALRAQTFRRRLRLIDGGLAVAARRDEGKSCHEAYEWPHRAATVPRDRCRRRMPRSKPPSCTRARAGRACSRDPSGRRQRRPARRRRSRCQARELRLADRARAQARRDALRDLHV